MAARVDEVARRVERLSRGLRDAGLRLTHQRLEVVRVIAADETHPDVEAVYRAVRERVPTISLDTVYRTLATLAERGLISRVQFTAGAARYDANPARHHHFVCTRCGLIRDVEDADLDAIRPAAGGHPHRATRRGIRPVPRGVRRLPEHRSDHALTARQDRHPGSRRCPREERPTCQTRPARPARPPR